MKSRKPKRIRMHPLGPSADGESYLMAVCPDSKTAGDTEPEVMVCTRAKPGEPGPIGAQIGQFHPLEDGHIEFEPIDTRTKKIAVEDRTEEGKGPAKYNSQAFRDGWLRIFGKN